MNATPTPTTDPQDEPDPADTDSVQDTAETLGPMAYTPQRGRGFKIIVWLILAGFALCLLAMLAVMIFAARP